MAIVELGSEQQAAAGNCKEVDEEVSSYNSSQVMVMKAGVRHLSDSGISRLPDSYVLPAPDRPVVSSRVVVNLPVVDLATLRDPSRRAAALHTLDDACRRYGFFQVPYGRSCGYIFICDRLHRQTDRQTDDADTHSMLC